MSKKIKIPMRSAGTPSADQWVHQKVDLDPKEKPKRLTIDVPPALHRRLKLYCVKQDVEIATFLRGVINQAIPDD